MIAPRTLATNCPCGYPLSTHPLHLLPADGAEGIPNDTHSLCKPIYIIVSKMWHYLPTAFSEYKAALLDVAMQRGYLNAFYPQGAFKSPYSDMLFRGALPSSTNYNETNSFKHYLHCLKIQCDMLSLSSYQETYGTYEFMLNTAENQIREFKKRGMSGQNRDFAPAIEVNRIAMCANDEDYGLKLRFDWFKK